MSFWNNKPLLITVAIILVLVILVFATSGHATENGMDSLAGKGIAVIQDGLYGATDNVGQFFGRLFAATDIDKENLALKEELANLKSQLETYNEMEQENKRLRELLKVQDVIGDYSYITARVIAATPGNWMDELVINVGAEDGIEKNMIVMTQDGILGKVTAVGDTYCRIITLLNSSGGIACLVERSRDTGVVKVSKDENGDPQLIIDYMGDDADVVPGDVIVTSGMGGVYPKGLTIGTVAQVSAAKNGSGRTITVSSGVDFDHVEEVVVITQLFDEVTQ